MCVHIYVYMHFMYVYLYIRDPVSYQLNKWHQ